MRSTHYVTYLFAKWACVWIQLQMDRKRRAEAPPLFSEGGRALPLYTTLM